MIGNQVIGFRYSNLFVRNGNHDIDCSSSLHGMFIIIIRFRPRNSQSVCASFKRMCWHICFNNLSLLVIFRAAAWEENQQMSSSSTQTLRLTEVSALGWTTDTQWITKVSAILMTILVIKRPLMELKCDKTFQISVGCLCCADTLY